MCGVCVCVFVLNFFREEKIVQMEFQHNSMRVQLIKIPTNMTSSDIIKARMTKLRCTKHKHSRVMTHVDKQQL